MEDIKSRVVNAIHELMNRYFEAPERNWSSATHEAIARVRAELVGRVEAEFGGGAGAAPSPAHAAPSMSIKTESSKAAIPAADKAEE